LDEDNLNSYMHETQRIFHIIQIPLTIDIRQ